MNSRLKKRIYILIIVIILIIGVILILKKDDESENEIYVNIEKSKENDDKEEKHVITESKYYNVVSLVRKYYNQINRDNYVDRTGNNFADDELVKKSIYDILDEETIKENNITVDNIYSYIPKVTGTNEFIALDINVEEGFGIDKYLVSGILTATWKPEEPYSKVNVLVSIDYKNNTFSIKPLEQGEIEINSSIDEIKPNDYNTYREITVDDQELTKEKFNNLKLLILRKSEELYDMLDEEYKTKKFGDYQGYVTYIDDNYERLSTMYLTKYKVDQRDNYTQYTCIDNYGKYIIFNNVSANNMRILLDTYTVDIPEFMEKYNVAKEQEKVGLNIERFISAINDQDYKYAYNCLDEVFRSKNMPTQQDFEDYVKRNMFEYNLIEHDESDKQGNTFVYDITIRDGKDEQVQGREFTVIMRLEEGTDFVMSFSKK